MDLLGEEGESIDVSAQGATVAEPTVGPQKKVKPSTVLLVQRPFAVDTDPIGALAGPRRHTFKFPIPPR